jgi:hypothetical protein
LGGNVTGRAATLDTGHQNNYNLNAAYLDVIVQAPAWTTNGIEKSAGNPLTATDLTSSGTVAIQALNAMPAGVFNATSATTYTHLANTYFPVPPTQGTNVSATQAHSIYAAGEIYTASDISTQTGAFLKGTLNLNKSAGTAVTEIGDGTTSGTVTIGGASNTTNLASATLQSGGVAAVSCSAGTVSLTTLVVTNGIVTHC